MTPKKETQEGINKSPSFLLLWWYMSFNSMKAGESSGSSLKPRISSIILSQRRIRNNSNNNSNINNPPPNDNNNNNDATDNNNNSKTLQIKFELQVGNKPQEEGTMILPAKYVHTHFFYSLLNSFYLWVCSALCASVSVNICVCLLCVCTRTCVRVYVACVYVRVVVCICTCMHAHMVMLVHIHSTQIGDFLKRVKRQYNISEDLIVKTISGVVLAPELAVQVAHSTVWYSLHTPCPIHAHKHTQSLRLTSYTAKPHHSFHQLTRIMAVSLLCNHKVLPLLQVQRQGWVYFFFFPLF